MHNGILTIAAERSTEDKQEEDGRIIRQERYHGTVTRSFSLGEGVNAEDIRASFSDGVLMLTAPKTKETDTAEIEIH